MGKIIKRIKQIQSSFMTVTAWVFSGIVLLFLLFPLYWMFVSSFKTNLSLYRIPPQFFPLNPIGDNYVEIARSKAFLTYFGNNFLTSISTTILTMSVSVLAGYALSRMRSKVADKVCVGLLSTQIFPVVGLIVALYTFFLHLGLLDTRTSLVLVLSATAIPFSTWLLKGFFDDLPLSLEEAAEIDGCGKLRILTDIVLPLSKPGLLAIGIYTFMVAWDDFLYCLTLIVSDSLRTLSVGISMRYLGEVSYDWAQVTTVSVIGSAPMYLLFLFFQRYMVRGLTAGAVKG